ncbi:MAG: DUF1566 domain-containing protein, partial [Gammaproteobacteria bacterium]|nr:DUF1566 domain-containing protein [Gammaproteobacteria bacterium]
GDLEKGVAWPNPRFTDNTDGTVTDNLTGLIWLKDAGCMGARQWSHLSSATFGFISRLNGGEDFSCTDYIANTYSDWRLPNIRELFSLIRYGFLRPALPNTVGTGQWSEGDPFVGVSVSGNHWSSSTHAVTSGEVWHMDMAGGWVDHTGKTASFRVWPVRGGQ